MGQSAGRSVVQEEKNGVWLVLLPLNSIKNEGKLTPYTTSVTLYSFGDCCRQPENLF